MIYDLKKVKKSIQAILITFVVGALVPRIFSLSDFGLVNKLAWKGLLGAAFGIATFLVGILYSCHLISGKRSGGKTRIGIYISIVLILCCAAPMLALVVATMSKIVAVILTFAMMCGLTYLICKLIKWLSKKKRSEARSIGSSAKNQEIKSHDNTSIENNIQNTVVSGDVKSEIIESCTIEKPTITEQSTGECEEVTGLQPAVEHLENFDACYTLYELAMYHDFESGCMTVTNDENPDLKWVKIYKPCYGNGKFYGYVMMNNAHHSVNGEIFFANRPIWYLV